MTSEIRLPKPTHCFLDTILVVCPKCGKCATLQAKDRYCSQYALSCLACGHSKSDLQMYSYLKREARLAKDWGLTLWLTTTIGKRTIWAHLEDLEYFVTSDWRTDRHKYVGTKSNWSYRTRLPQWMHEKKSQTDLLRAIRTIRRLRLAK